jgi:hypothetical protein
VRARRLIGGALVGLGVLCGALLIPEPAPRPDFEPAGQPFAWNRDAYWSGLEAAFDRARANGCQPTSADDRPGLDTLRQALEAIENEPLQPSHPAFERLEAGLFETAPDAAACPDRAADWIDLAHRARAAVKRQSVAWDLSEPVTHDLAYRLLYGGRLAIEEVLLQKPPETASAPVVQDRVPSATPSRTVHGVAIHSGDLLVSRGGAPTSALIARGNDYPGNFSHVAVAHVHPTTGAVSIVEAHIECGVAISSVDDYLRDRKLRVMVLRVRPDHPALERDPTLPHAAATLALERARTEHVPYDFAMDFRDPSKLFCSEVASWAYGEVGISLWANLSSISGPTVVPWLADFGVRHFITQAPSDLEYDPQLAVVAEWRDPDALFDDHVDNAVIDAMLETAEAGQRLAYGHSRLPAARVLKAYSVVVELFGKVGPVPEGMSASAALRNQAFSTRHQQVRQRTLELAAAFAREHGYRPPYWELVRLAREALAGLGPEPGRG